MNTGKQKQIIGFIVAGILMVIIGPIVTVIALAGAPLQVVMHGDFGLMNAAGLGILLVLLGIASFAAAVIDLAIMVYTLLPGAGARKRAAQ